MKVLHLAAESTDFRQTVFAAAANQIYKAFKQDGGIVSTSIKEQLGVDRQFLQKSAQEM